MTRKEIVYTYLQTHAIAYDEYDHPEGKTIEEAMRWWRDDGSVHCKNIFLRNLGLEPGSVSPFGLINATSIPDKMRILGLY